MSGQDVEMMDPHRVALLRIAGQLAQIQEDIAERVASPLVSENEMRLMAATAQLLAVISRRSMRDGVRWATAYQSNQEAWLVVHAKDGDVELIYHGSLSREQRAVLGR